MPDQVIPILLMRMAMVSMTIARTIAIATAKEFAHKMAREKELDHRMAQEMEQVHGMALAKVQEMAKAKRFRWRRQYR